MWWSSKSRSDRSATEVRPLPSSPYIFEALSERSASRCACATTTASWTIQNHWQGIPKSTDSSFFSLFKCHFMRYTGNPISRQISKIIKNPKMSQVSSLIRICIQESLSVVAPFGKALNSLGGPRERPSGNAFSASANARIADANPVKSDICLEFVQTMMDSEVCGAWQPGTMISLW